MAKKQSFGDKTSKQGAKKGTHIKLVRAIKTEKGSISFKKEPSFDPISKAKFIFLTLFFKYLTIFLKWSKISEFILDIKV